MRRRTIGNTCSCDIPWEGVGCTELDGPSGVPGSRRDRRSWARRPVALRLRCACCQAGHVTMWAVVPLKSPEVAKSRLNGALGTAGRRELFFSMARQVIGALLDTPPLEYVAVVTASAEVAGFAQALGASVIWEEREAGTATACRAAVAAASGRTDSLLMLSGDLPLASAAALEPLVCLQTARHGSRSLRIGGGSAPTRCCAHRPMSSRSASGPTASNGTWRHAAPRSRSRSSNRTPCRWTSTTRRTCASCRRRLLAGAAPASRELSEVLAAGGQVLAQ